MTMLTHLPNVSTFPFSIQPPTPLSTHFRKTIPIPAMKMLQTTFPLPKIRRFVPQTSITIRLTLFLILFKTLILC